MIYLSPQVRSGLGEDTFWTWFHREFKSSFDVPSEINANDVVLQYSTLGASRVKGGKKVALLWELHPEMVKRGMGGADVMPAIRECEALSDFRVIASPIMAEFYADAKVLPIGVDTDLFKPMQGMKEKHGICAGEYGFWSGTSHPMKGSDRINVPCIRVPKKPPKPQKVLAELMNCADYLLVCSRLRPFFMVEWEAMACGLPVRNISGLEKDFVPSSNPRDDVFRLGWSRHQAKELWRDFLQNEVGCEI